MTATRGAALSVLRSDCHVISAIVTYLSHFLNKNARLPENRGRASFRPEGLSVNLAVFLSWTLACARPQIVDLIDAIDDTLGSSALRSPGSGPRFLARARSNPCSRNTVRYCLLRPDSGESPAKVLRCLQCLSPKGITFPVFQFPDLCDPPPQKSM